jgi:hypothetical protein
MGERRDKQVQGVGMKKKATGLSKAAKFSQIK